MKFDEQRLKALEQALGPDFFCAFAKLLGAKMQKVEHDCRDRELKLRIAYTYRPKIPCVPVGRCR